MICGKSFSCLIGVAVLFAADPSLGAASQVADRPNVLIVHVDQLRFDCLGVCGNPDVKTPNLDRLAADGVRYVNSFCAFPVCTPSRYSLISGRPAHEHAAWDNRCTLPPTFNTFPKIFRAAGYRTKAVGKMHYTPTYLDVGFEEMILSEQDGPGRWDDDYHRYLMHRGLVDRNDLQDQVAEYRQHVPPEYWDTMGAMVSNLPEAHHSTTWIGDRAMEGIQSWDSRGGHLLMVGFIKPHHPFDPPAPWDKLYDADKLTLLPGWTAEPLARDFQFARGYFPYDRLTETRLRRVMAYYYANISLIDRQVGRLIALLKEKDLYDNTLIDRQVGRLIALLKEKDLYDNTLIVFTADHGEYMGFHHMILKANYMYDPLVKVPLLIKWPGGRRAGTISERLVNNTDLAPTLCRAAGLRPDAEMHGDDLGVDGPSREIVFCEQGPPVMARTRTCKLIVLGGPPDKDLFFDLRNDPQELHNLAGTSQVEQEAKRLRAAIAAWRPKRLPPRYVDLQAPQISGPNVPGPGLDHRKAIMDYYRNKMQ